MKTVDIGHRAQLIWIVDDPKTIRLGKQRTAVFSTPSMITLMEYAAREALRPFLENDEESVGTNVEVIHSAPTPIGMEVRGVASVTGVQGANVTFAVEAFDGAERIGHGRHERAVIDMARFDHRVAKKRGPTSATPNFMERIIDLALPDSLRVQVSGELVRVTLNRPAKRNALNREMTSALASVFAWLHEHPEIRVLVLEGAGGAFCAGNDLLALGSFSTEDAAAWNEAQIELLRKLRRLPQVSVAAVRGTALGAGCVLAAMCDFRVAARGATFGLPEVRHGWPPSFGIARMAEILGQTLAAKWCLTGKTISADEALADGLVHELLPAAMFEERIQALVTDLLKVPAMGLRETRLLLDATISGSEVEIDRATHQAYLRAWSSDDARKALQAFAESREPSGRKVK